MPFSRCTSICSYYTCQVRPRSCSSLLTPTHNALLSEDFRLTACLCLLKWLRAQQQPATPRQDTKLDAPPGGSAALNNHNNNATVDDDGEDADEDGIQDTTKVEYNDSGEPKGTFKLLSCVNDSSLILYRLCPQQLPSVYCHCNIRCVV